MAAIEVALATDQDQVVIEEAVVVAAVAAAAAVVAEDEVVDSVVGETATEEETDGASPIVLIEVIQKRFIFAIFLALCINPMYLCLVSRSLFHLFDINSFRSH